MAKLPCSLAIPSIHSSEKPQARQRNRVTGMELSLVLANTVTGDKATLATGTPPLSLMFRGDGRALLYLADVHASY